MPLGMPLCTPGGLFEGEGEVRYWPFTFFASLIRHETSELRVHPTISKMLASTENPGNNVSPSTEMGDWPLILFEFLIGVDGSKHLVHPTISKELANIRTFFQQQGVP